MCDTKTTNTRNSDNNKVVRIRTMRILTHNFLQSTVRGYAVFLQECSRLFACRWFSCWILLSFLATVLRCDVMRCDAMWCYTGLLKRTIVYSSFCDGWEHREVAIKISYIGRHDWIVQIDSLTRHLLILGPFLFSPIQQFCCWLDGYNHERDNTSLLRPFPIPIQD